MSDAASGGKKQGKMLALLFVVVNLTVLGGGSFLVYMATLGYEAPKMIEHEAMASLIAEREERALQSVLYSLDRFDVNLAGAPKRNLRVELHLEMLDEQGFEEAFTLQAEARDSIVRLLGSKRFSDIESMQGKLFLKDQIATTLNNYMKEGVVKDVYFSEFLVK